jgi:hypothetical protein
MTTPEIKLYHPPDVDTCHASWGATCGPCSLAAALEVPVADVRLAVSTLFHDGDLFDAHFRGYMGIRQMEAALGVLMRRAEPVPMRKDVLSDILPAAAQGPVLACIQWGGPWHGTRGAAVHRHWVVFRCGYDHGIGPVHVYDWNAKHRATVRTFDGVSEHVDGSRWSEREEVRAGGWLTLEQWEGVLVPRLLPDRSDGTWRIQWAGAVRP